jgi:hypothetical protein
MRANGWVHNAGYGRLALQSLALASTTLAWKEVDPGQIGGDFTIRLVDIVWSRWAIRVMHDDGKRAGSLRHIPPFEMWTDIG